MSQQELDKARKLLAIEQARQNLREELQAGDRGPTADEGQKVPTPHRFPDQTDESGFLSFDKEWIPRSFSARTLPGPGLIGPEPPSPTPLLLQSGSGMFRKFADIVGIGKDIILPEGAEEDSPGRAFRVGLGAGTREALAPIPGVPWLSQALGDKPSIEEQDEVLLRLGLYQDEIDGIRANPKDRFKELNNLNGFFVLEYAENVAGLPQSEAELRGRIVGGILGGLLVPPSGVEHDPFMAIFWNIPMIGPMGQGFVRGARTLFGRASPDLIAFLKQQERIEKARAVGEKHYRALLRIRLAEEGQGPAVGKPPPASSTPAIALPAPQITKAGAHTVQPVRTPPPQSYLGGAVAALPKPSPEALELAKRQLPDLPHPAERLNLIKKEDGLRQFVNLPFIRKAMPWWNPRSVVANPAQEYLAGLADYRFIISQYVDTAMSSLRSLGREKDVFWPTDRLGLFSKGPFKGQSISDLGENFRNVKGRLTALQKEYIITLNRLGEGALDMLARYGIDIRRMSVEDGQLFISRQAAGKFVQESGSEVFITSVHRGGTGSIRRPGMSPFFFKPRAPGKAAERTGIVWLSGEETTYNKLTTAYRSISEKLLVARFLETVPWLPEATPADLQSTINIARSAVARYKISLTAAKRIAGLKNGNLLDATRDAFRETGMVLGLEDRLGTAKDAHKAVHNLRGQVTQMRRSANRTIKRWNTSTDRNQAALDRIRLIERRMAARESELDEFRRIADRIFAQKKNRLDTERIAGPLFKGKVFIGQAGVEQARLLKAGFAKTEIEFLRHLNKLQDVGRTFTLGADLGSFMIQLQFMPGMPVEGAKTLKGLILGLFDPRYLPKLYKRNKDLIDRNPDVIWAGMGQNQEYTLALHRGGWLNPNLQIGPQSLINLPFRIAGQALGRMLEPWGRAFEASFDTAAIELLKAFEYKVVGSVGRAEMNSLVNHLRGLENRARLGISPTQRQLESFTLLATRYNAAFAVLLTDVLRGNLRGELARQSLGRGLAAMYMINLAVSISKGETMEQALDHMDPYSPRYFRWEFNGQYFGMGGKAKSVSNLLTQITMEPSSVFEVSMRNPFFRFTRGLTSPILSLGLDVITGRDYSGELTREGLPEFGEHIVATPVMPIWLQSVMLEGGDFKARTARGFAEFIGLQSVPETPGSKFRLYVEKDRNSRTGEWFYWEDFPTSGKFSATFYKRGDERGRKLWNEYQKDLIARGRKNDYLREIWVNKQIALDDLRDKIADFDLETGPFRKVREWYSDYGKTLGNKAKDAKREHKEAYEDLQKFAAPEREFDVAFNLYMEIVTDPDLDDDILGFDFKARDERLRMEVGPDSEFGERVWVELQRAEKFRESELPDLILELIKDRNFLNQHYWSITDREIEASGLVDILKEYRGKSLIDQKHYLLFNRKGIELSKAFIRIEARQWQARMPGNGTPSEEAIKTRVAETLLKWEYSTSVLHPDLSQEVRDSIERVLNK
jgi:hypothetical protein